LYPVARGTDGVTRANHEARKFVLGGPSGNQCLARFKRLL
jgi:hypothetical protein